MRSKSYKSLMDEKGNAYIFSTEAFKTKMKEVQRKRNKEGDEKVTLTGLRVSNGELREAKTAS